jgi:arylsulfatase A-like enzyme
MTGVAAARHRVTNWTRNQDTPTDGRSSELVLPDWNVNGMSLDPSTRRAFHPRTTLPMELSRAGYRTIHVGKAHFGAGGTPGADPRNLGFQVSIAGTAAGQPASYLGTERFEAKASSTNRFWDVPDLEAYRGQEIFLTEALTREAVRAVEEALRDAKPFFLYMAHYAVHTPITADPRFEPRYRAAGLDPIEAAYASMIEGMDRSLGDLLDLVDRHGIAANTLILFLSDNGGLSAVARGGVPHTHNAPLSSGKGSSREGGLRVPMILRWPGITPAGSHCTHPVMVEDVMPTLLGACRVHVSPSRRNASDGRDLAPLLRGDPPVPVDRPLFWHYPNVWGPSGPGIGPFSAVREGDWKLVYRHTDGALELFQLSNDLSESSNVAAIHPDVARRLAQLLTRHLRSTHAQLPKVRSTGRTVPYPDAVIGR